MQQKTAVITILFLIVAVSVGVAGWYYFSSSRNVIVEGVPEAQTSQNFFPFGSRPATPQTGTTATTETSAGSQEVVTLRQISKEPIAGFFIIEKKKEPPTVRYIEQATGHIYETALDIASTTRLSNTTIPRVREALFVAPTGDRAVIRYLDTDGETIITFSGSVKRSTTTAEGMFTGSFLPEGITALAIHPNGSKIFYLLESGSGVNGFTRNPDGSKAAKAFSSPLREWIPDWISENSVILTTKASAGASGVALRLNPQSGESVPLAAGNGLTAAGKGNLLLYRQGAALSLLDTASGKTQAVPLDTLTEKCLVRPGTGALVVCGIPSSFGTAVYPDAWYQGIAHLDDSLWTMDVKTSETRQLSTLQTNGGPLDVISPQSSVDGAYIVFINKRDGTLWSVRIKSLP